MYVCSLINAEHPNVVSVFLNKGRKLHTTRSWDFLRLEKDGVIPSGSLWKKSRFGSDTIIGNLDTGKFRTSPSVCKNFINFEQFFYFSISFLNEILVLDFMCTRLNTTHFIK